MSNIDLIKSQCTKEIVKDIEKIESLISGLSKIEVEKKNNEGKKEKITLNVNLALPKVTKKEFNEVGKKKFIELVNTLEVGGQKLKIENVKYFASNKGYEVNEVVDFAKDKNYIK